MVSGAQGGDVYAGDTEARLRAAFDEAAESLKCSPKRPVMIFIDEIVRSPLSPRTEHTPDLCIHVQDVMCPSRTESGSTETRVVAQLLTLLDGMKNRGNIVRH